MVEKKVTQFHQKLPKCRHDSLYFKRDAFQDEIECPVDLQTIEIYHQILKPAYEFSIGLQGRKSSICDIIPSLHRIMFIWDNLEING